MLPIVLTCLRSTLFERTSNELTIYLGPWEVLEAATRQVVWQCNYQGETLEQFRAYEMTSWTPELLAE